METKRKHRKHDKLLAELSQHPLVRQANSITKNRGFRLLLADGGLIQNTSYKKCRAQLAKLRYRMNNKKETLAERVDLFNSGKMPDYISGLHAKNTDSLFIAALMASTHLPSLPNREYELWDFIVACYWVDNKYVWQRRSNL